MSQVLATGMVVSLLVVIIGNIGNAVKASQPSNAINWTLVGVAALAIPAALIEGVLYMAGAGLIAFSWSAVYYGLLAGIFLNMILEQRVWK